MAIEHRSAVALLSWAKTVYTAEDLAGVLASTSICFDLSVFELFCSVNLRRQGDPGKETRWSSLPCLLTLGSHSSTRFPRP